VVGVVVVVVVGFVMVVVVVGFAVVLDAPIVCLLFVYDVLLVLLDSASQAALYVWGVGGRGER